ncbi:MAG: 1-deoxy-D-xylulose-5-phosphate reductoisomerase [Firmicutes bacterium]|nr:1-deoxy-D-xylulose-5-phosphate reductoisomerase [Bacillota bacterium]
MLNIAILGSTGSIGTQTLEVIKHLPDCQVFGLSANSNVALLKEQINIHQPKMVVIGDQSKVKELGKCSGVSISAGNDGLCELASHPEVDLVVVALVGAAGLQPTIAALQAGKRVALANKETLVAGGHLVMEYREQLIPIDSEHSAIWQCLDGKNISEVKEIILTASGGPFLNYTGELAKVTVMQALKHPNWDMGGKITIDSATLMNKGLEVIEAHWLFGFDYDKIEVVIHPQSIIHSMVRFCDGTIIAQLGTTDMRLPIQYALTYPQIKPSIVPDLDLTKLSELTFAKPDLERFPCLKLAYQAGKIGGTLPTVMNAANEIAVELFMQEKISFTAIPQLIEMVMEEHQPIFNPTLNEILEIDISAREAAMKVANQLKGRMK